MKLHKYVLTFAATMFICCSCAAENKTTPDTAAPTTNLGQAAEIDSPSSSEPIQTKESAADASPSTAPSEAAEDMKRVGEEHYGFWNIPTDWVVFLDAGAAKSENMIQYSNLGGTNIITVKYYPDFNITPEDLLNRQAAYMKEINGENITGAKVKLNDIDALQVYCAFPDDTIMVSWAFESEEGGLHLIIAEGPTSTIFETVSYLESSYALEK